MKKFFQQKLFWQGFLGLLFISFIFTFAFMGSTVNPTLKDLPLAVVVEDEGVTLPNNKQLNIGETFEEQIKKKDQESIDWTVLNSRDEAIEGMNEKEYYGAIIFPNDLSKTIFSLLKDSSGKAKVEVLINEGMNANAAKMAGQISDGIVAKLNQQVQQNLYDQASKQKMTLSVDQLKALATPIHVKTEKLNPVGSHTANGNAPVLFTQILWITTFIGSIILFLVIKKLGLRKWTVSTILSQLLGGLLFVLSICGLVFWLASGLLDVSIPDNGEMFLLMLFTGLMFFFIQGALFNWIGYAAAPLLVLLFFFSTPVLTLPPEMLPEVTRDWLYSWVPFRFSVEAFKDTFFFGVNPLEDGIGVLGYTGLTGFVVMILAPIKPKRNAKEQKSIVVNE
ncbi:YhgE/Pip family protein [Pseudalkalibacillus decolorationis]|uniref:YhgE/Pip domain-containing protein n=1 Tax=Pseudalkalibacillus decolorationis TaxID=163879 RepID=UPI002148D35A|nr:YhgE/Pip family protein [Pseudalkalibacillus decolorationis]